MIVSVRASCLCVRAWCGRSLAAGAFAPTRLRFCRSLRHGRERMTGQLTAYGRCLCVVNRYGLNTPDELQYLRSVAETTGIVLDPVYVGASRNRTV
jgi:hypothetical protein